MRHILLSSKDPRVLCLLLVVAWSTTSSVSAAFEDRRRRRARPWSLPNVPPQKSQGRNWLEECESVAAFLETLRGGSDWGDGDRRRYAGARYSRWDGGPDDSDNDDDDDYRQEEEDDYYGRESRPSRSRQSSSSSSFAFLESMPGAIKNGDRRVGLGLLGSGGLITLLGISLFFNKTLLRLGNLLFIAGVPITVGPSRTMSYFLQPQKARATACLGLGIFLVLAGSPVFGMVLEFFGLLNLFGNMFPVLFVILKQMPVIGPLLNQKKKDSRRTPGRDDFDDFDEDRRYQNEGGYEEDWRDNSRYNEDRSRRDPYKQEDYNDSFYQNNDQDDPYY